MKSIEKYMNLGAVILPFAATIAAIVLFWNELVTAGDLVIFAVMYLLTADRDHRRLSPAADPSRLPDLPGRSATSSPALGEMAVQGSVIAWVADHRKHHAHTDVDGDPHSPHVGHGDGLGGVLRGLWHAHTGWLIVNHGRADWRRYAPDLYEDPGMRWLNRHFPARASCSASRSRPSPGSRSAAPWPAPRWACSGAASSGSSSSTT